MNILKEVVSKITDKHKLMLTIFDTRPGAGGELKSVELANKLSNYLDKKVDKRVWVTIDDLIHITGFCATVGSFPIDYKFRVTAYLDGELFNHWIDVV
jgi:hypothetical protein